MTQRAEAASPGPLRATYPGSEVRGNRNDVFRPWKRTGYNPPLGRGLNPVGHQKGRVR